MKRPASLLLLALLLLISLGGTSAARGETPLIPRELLFGNPERSAPQLSPDGMRIAWLAPDEKGVENVWVQPVAGGTPRLLTHERERPIFFYCWAADGRHMLYLQDGAGDEVNHVYSADLADGNVRDLTPFRGVRAQNLRIDLAHPHTILVALNLRDRKVFDSYHVDLESGAITLAAKNPGDVLTWTTDTHFVIRGATAFDPKSGQTILRVRDSAAAPWRDVVKMPFERALFSGQVVGGSLIAGFSRDGKSLFIHSALHSDMGRLVRIDAKSGRELEVVASDPNADVDDLRNGPAVIANPVTHALEAVCFNYQTPRWVFLDPSVGADFARIEKEVPAFLTLLSRDRADRTWIVIASRSDLPPAYYTFNRKTKHLALLFADYPKLAGYPLAPKKPVVIPARDGLKLVSYLTLPPGLEPKKLPLILNIHGGPWFRDDAGYDPEVQLLANRGYAVLQVNYRGSTGFGLKFLNASTHQWGRGTQDDLYDAVAWAVGEGIADPKRVAAYGWSGGGYATLRALSQRPDLFVCGVDGVGPADIATLFRSFPTYWEGIMARWRRRVGDADHDEALNREISPLYHVTDIRAPLLIGQGANDPRVTIANADAMVKALRENHREVVYIVYPDEGHGWARPENNLDYYGRVEEFLAKHLGGRAEAWKKIEGSSAEVR
jgi:dipeptidyl aminopeptidase/acylaminoacyl peptidase